MKRSVVILIITNVILCIVLLYVGYKSLQYKRIISENRKEYDCLRGWTNSLESLHDTVDVVFFGNSITHGGCFDEAFPDLKVCNLGYPSDDLAGMRKRIPQVVALHPRKIFIMGGTNNLSGYEHDSFELQYKELIIEIKKQLPESSVFVQSILPYNSTVCKAKFKVDRRQATIEANKIIENIARSEGLRYIDLHSLYIDNDGQMDISLTIDGAHLKEEAYIIWYKEIKQYIYD